MPVDELNAVAIEKFLRILGPFTTLHSCRCAVVEMRAPMKKHVSLAMDSCISAAKMQTRSVRTRQL